MFRPVVQFSVFFLFIFFYQHGNYTRLLGPQIDTYLPESIQYLPKDPKTILELGDYPNIPIMIGICSNEGAFIQGIICSSLLFFEISTWVQTSMEMISHRISVICYVFIFSFPFQNCGLSWHEKDMTR